jgi:hypothetical protein
VTYAADLSLSAEESGIAASLRQVLEQEWSPSRARWHCDDPAPGHRLWQHVRDWGVLGDAGLGALCLAHEELGAALAPAHLWGANLAAMLLRRLEHPLADAMAAGDVRVTSAAATSPGADPPLERWIAEPDGADVVITLGAGEAVLNAEPGCTSLSTIDASRRFGALVGAGRQERLPLPPAARETYRHVGALMAAADSLGACRRLVEASRSYALERQQFGRPIAAFQALAHRIVDMDAAVHLARAALHRAAVLVGAAAPGREEAVLVAKGATGSAVRQVARDAVQVHGAIGFTWDLDVHLWIRRAYVSDRLFGSGSSHDQVLAGALANPVRPSSRDGADSGEHV